MFPKRSAPAGVGAVPPADHLIGKPREYVRLLRPAFRAAAEGKIAVIGIQPRWAETGYGYIEFANHKPAGSGKVRVTTPVNVTSFREKPDAKTAEAFVAAGNFYWNA